MHILEHWIDLWIAAILLFLVPLLFYSYRQDMQCQAYVTRRTIDFVEQIETQGILWKQSYENYMLDLNRTGIPFEVELTHQKKQYLPVYTSQEPKLFTGEVLCFEDTQLHREILNMLDQNKKYILDQGEHFDVKVINKSQTMGMKLFNLIFRTSYFVTTYQQGTIRGLWDRGE